MPHIGPVMDNLENRAWGNGNFPDRLPPGRGKGTRARLAVTAVWRRGWFELRLDVHCGMHYRTRFEARRGMDDGARLKARLGLDHPPGQEAVLNDEGQRTLWPELPAGDISRADGVAQQVDQLQVQCRNDEAGGGFQAHARQEQTRVPVRCLDRSALRSAGKSTQILSGRALAGPCR